MRCLIILVSLCLASAAGATSYTPAQVVEGHEEALIALENLKFHDLSAPDGPPAIPRTWKLIGVTGGDNANAFTLWFQADDGAVYALQGLMSQNRIALHDQVFKLPAR